MKKITCALILILFLIAAHTGYVWASELEDGFPGLRWGAEISGNDVYEKIRTQGQVDFYRTPGKVYLVFDQEVPDVIFGFHDDRFFAAYIRIDSLDVFGKLKSELTGKYGEPETRLSMKKEQTVYKWKNDKIKIKLKVGEKEAMLKMGIYYTPISEKIDEDRQEEFLERTPLFFPTENGKVPDRVPLFKF